MNTRYSRQANFYGFGTDAQEKLGTSRVAIVGMGALGTVAAEELAREGVGFLRLIDRDIVEISNLQRQVLYTEQDAQEQLPKVIAAADHLNAINSEIIVEPVLDDLNSGNGEAYLQDVDLVIDATDNLDTRCLINEICVEHAIPWIYGGVLEAEGMTMVFRPGGPCLACVTGSDTPVNPPGAPKTCATAGVLNSATAITASLQVLEATKLLTGSEEVREGLLSYQLWENRIELLPVVRQENCPICQGRRYRYLGHTAGLQTQSLCGKDAVQITPPEKREISFDVLAERLSAIGSVTVNRFFLEYEDEEVSFQVFKNGRALIRKISDPARAKAIYQQYIGS